jgi:hypothetical protein
MEYSAFAWGDRSAVPAFAALTNFTNRDFAAVTHRVERIKIRSLRNCYAEMQFTDCKV